MLFDNFNSRRPRCQLTLKNICFCFLFRSNSQVWHARFTARGDSSKTETPTKKHQARSNCYASANTTTTNNKNNNYNMQLQQYNTIAAFSQRKHIKFNMHFIALQPALSYILPSYLTHALSERKIK